MDLSLKPFDQAILAVFSAVQRRQNCAFVLKTLTYNLGANAEMPKNPLQ